MKDERVSGEDDVYGGYPQPAEWAVVFREIRTLDDALALMGMYEYREDMLYANDLPIDAFTRSWALLGERSLSEWLAEHIGAGAACPFRDEDLYSGLRGREPDAAAIAAFVERCRQHGVTLAHRPRPPSPWRVAVAQLAGDGDAAAFGVLAAEYVANSWPFELDDVEMPALPGRTPTADDHTDFVARCRRAGVVFYKD